MTKSKKLSWPAMVLFGLVALSSPAAAGGPANCPAFIASMIDAAATLIGLDETTMVPVTEVGDDPLARAAASAC